MRLTQHILFYVLVALLDRGVLSYALETEHTGGENTSNSICSSDTCADPTLATVICQGFQAAVVLHVLNFRYDFEHSNTLNSAAIWVNVHGVFRGWETQQPFTVPLFQLGTPDRQDYVYMVGPDAQTPPVIGGFNTDIAVVAWVYDTPVCNSVPLMSAAYAPRSDHYYTTEADQHAGLIKSGWVDSGVVAYVLPLSSV